MELPANLGSGWRPLCEELQTSLERLEPAGELLDVWIDETGRPRFRVKLTASTRAEGRRLVRECESRALELCEVCGGPCHVRGGVILTVRCEHCR